MRWSMTVNNKFDFDTLLCNRPRRGQTKLPVQEAEGQKGHTPAYLTGNSAQVITLVGENHICSFKSCQVHCILKIRVCGLVEKEIF